MIKIYLVALFICLLSAAPSRLYAANSGNKAAVVERMMELFHGSPRPFDDSLCNDVLNDYLQSLDYAHMYFTEPDIEKIKAATHVKAGMECRDPDFLNTITALYRQRLLWADTVIAGILQKTFDFSGNDSIVFGKAAAPYAAGDNELKKRWQKLLKYETLHRITEIVLYDTTATKDYMLQQQRGEEKTVLKIEERRIKKVLNNPAGYEDYMLNLFCNTITTAYDPHSDFFPLNEKENFVGEVSGGGYAFGFELDDNDKREVEITHLTPGSPAWKSGQLNQNDVLLQLQWDGEPQVDLAGADADEISELLMGDNHRLLKLTVRKANGLTVTVPLRKEKAVNEDDFVKSYILNGDYKIGYTLLPGFYSEWENTGGSNCANDVAREVLKLKKENINGLILDLRNNGGGSMDEALALAGIFIDEGTLGFSKEKTGRPHALKDPNRGTLYDGPLLVMANGESASASEFVVGALQDYNRAIIVGSPTFGKATYQMVLPCDTTLNLDKATEESLANSKSDYIKVTMGKLYRVTGKTNQLNGAQPDVPLPDPYQLLEGHESAYKHALPADSVKRAIYFNQLPPLPIKELAAKSSARVNASRGFSLVKQSIGLYASMNKLKTATMPLSFDPYLGIVKKYGAGALGLIHQLEQDSLRSFKAENFGADKTRMALGGYEAEVNTRVLSAMMHDIYINESFLILADYIKLTK